MFLLGRRSGMQARVFGSKGRAKRRERVAATRAVDGGVGRSRRGVGASGWEPRGLSRTVASLSTFVTRGYWC